MLLAILEQGLAQRGPLVGEDRDRQQGRVNGARFADRECGDRNARRHLHCGQQGIEPVQVGRGQRDAEHRTHRVRRDGAGQMRRHPRRRDEDFRASRVGLFDVFGGLGRRAMG